MRAVAGHFFGRMGELGYAAFDYWNTTVFEKKLPIPLILWGLTEHGGSLGWVMSISPPVIYLHPSIVNPASENPWKMPTWMPGSAFTADVLLHELCHVAVSRDGGWENHPDRKSWWTCHQNPLWVAETNRVRRLLGYEDKDGVYQIRGIRRNKDGKVGYGFMNTKDEDQPTKLLHPENFPHNLSKRNAYYQAGKVPFDW